ncbi:MAG: hypothetical protein H0T62_12265 [Parachlamydiaceae bacterium]|nr:hypothetical protein [Parachlamydiaceae bacterium]
MEKKLDNTNSVDFNFIRQEMLTTHLNPSKLTNLNNTKEKLLNVLEEDARKKKEAFEKGYYLLKAQMEDSSIDGLFKANDELEPIAIENFKTNEEMLSSIFTLAFWKNYVKKPSKIQTQMNYSDEMLLCLYSLGSHFYEEKQYREAIDSYNFICMLNPSISSFWVALGLSLEGNNEMSSAFKAFERAVELTPFEIAPYIALIRCSEKLHDFRSVIELLNKASNNPNFEEDAKAALEYVLSVKR